MPPALMAPAPEHADGFAGRPGCRGEVKGPRRRLRTGRCPSLCLLTEIFQPVGADTSLVLCEKPGPASGSLPAGLCAHGQHSCGVCGRGDPWGQPGGPAGLSATRVPLGRVSPG